MSTSEAAASLPMAVESIPVACEFCPTAVVLILVACDSCPSAVAPSPIACESSPTAVEETPVAWAVFPTAVESSPDDVASSPSAVESRPDAVDKFFDSSSELSDVCPMSSICTSGPDASCRATSGGSVVSSGSCSSRSSRCCDRCAVGAVAKAPPGLRLDEDCATTMGEFPIRFSSLTGGSLRSTGAESNRVGSRTPVLSTALTKPSPGRLRPELTVNAFVPDRTLVCAAASPRPTIVIEQATNTENLTICFMNNPLTLALLVSTAHLEIPLFTTLKSEPGVMRSRLYFLIRTPLPPYASSTQNTPPMLLTSVLPSTGCVLGRGCNRLPRSLP